MKTPEKLAAGWLLTLGFMMMTLSVSAVLNKITMYREFPPGIEDGLYDQDVTNHGAVDQLNNTAVNGIIFGVPSIVLGSWLALGFYRENKQEQKALTHENNQRLQSLFYKMIQENQGRVTVLGFAMQSQLPPADARQYLDEQAKVFNANFKINEEGAVSYYFDV
ncbi:MAG: hypothetical protein QNJ47_24935 [Nostocaceae cyanobacterium]|nr:hypothetical protein [Nostocaceae cyanobacterium]